MATLRATYCVQTLAFADPRVFEPYCKGAILYSAFEKPEDVEGRRGKSVEIINPASIDPLELQRNGNVKLTGMSLIYDDWINAYNKNFAMRQNIDYFQSARICALYDHLRSNQLYNLTRPLREEQAARREPK